MLISGTLLAVVVILALGAAVIALFLYVPRSTIRIKQSVREPASAQGTGSANRMPAEKSESTSDSVYRTRRLSDEAPRHWDPYAPEQSRVERIRAARHDGPAGATSGPSHYQLLGLPPDANDDQVEQAYRRYVALIHPDRFFGDPTRRALAEQQLKELNAVMQVMRDPVRRAVYTAGLRSDPRKQP